MGRDNYNNIKSTNMNIEGSILSKRYHQFELLLKLVPNGLKVVIENCKTGQFYLGSFDNLSKRLESYLGQNIQIFMQSLKENFHDDSILKVSQQGQLEVQLSPDMLGLAQGQVLKFSFPTKKRHPSQFQLLQIQNLRLKQEIGELKKSQESLNNSFSQIRSMVSQKENSEQEVRESKNLISIISSQQEVIKQLQNELRKPNNLQKKQESENPGQSIQKKGENEKEGKQGQFSKRSLESADYCRRIVLGVFMCYILFKFFSWTVAATVILIMVIVVEVKFIISTGGQIEEEKIRKS